MPKTFPFTEAKVKALAPPADGREYHKDTRFPGLQLCVTSAGARTYYFVRRIEGKPTRIRLGTVEQLSVDAARDAAAQEAAKVAVGRNPQAERRAKRQQPTLQDLFDHWMLYANAHKKARSAKSDEWMFGRYLKPWAPRRLATIKKVEVQAHHAKIGRENGRYAANRAIVLLRAMYNKAEEIGYTGGNPTKGTKLFKENSRDRFLQPHEIGAFFQALENETPAFRHFFLILLLTGARRDNVQTMRWVDLDLDRAMWRIPETKGGTPVVVPLVQPVVAILRERHGAADDTEYVFPGRRGGHLTEPKWAWQRVCENAGLTNLHIHDLRRSLGSWMASSNASMPIIGKMLGHTSPQATAVYSRLYMDPVREAVDKATAAMLAAGGQTKLLQAPANGGNDAQA